MGLMLNNRRRRRFVIQLAIALLMATVLVFLAMTAQATLQKQGITSGFDFLFRSTGWDIGFSLIEYSISDPYWKVLLIGLVNTLFMGLIGLFIATVLGILVGTARTAANPVMNLVGTIYVETFRNVPLILQAFFWYAVYTHLPSPRQAYDLGGVAYLSSRGIFFPGFNVSASAALLAIASVVVAVAVVLWIGASRWFAGVSPSRRSSLRWTVFVAGLAVAGVLLVLGRVPGAPFISIPELAGLNVKGGIRIPPEFAALLTAMSLYGGAYIGEIIRAGYMSVGKGQLEAAHALGLKPLQIFTRIRLPLALRAVLPTLTNQYVWLLKATTLGIAVGFSDFFLVVSTSINQSGQTLELIAILMGGFLLVNYSLATVMNAVNRAIAIKGTQARG